MESLSKEIGAVVKVKVLTVSELFELSEFTKEQIPKILYHWELGGITDPLGQLIAWLWEQISGAFDLFRQRLWAHLDTIKSWIVGGVGTILDTVKKALDAAISGVRSVVDGISSTLSHFITYVKGAFDTIRAAIANISTVIATAVTGAVATLSAFIKTVGDAITRAADTIRAFIDSLGRSLSAAIAGVVTAITTLGQSIWRGIEGLWDTIKRYFDALKEAFSAFVSRILESFDKAVAGITGLLRTATDRIIDTFSRAFRVVATTLATLGVAIETFASVLFRHIYDLGVTIAGSFSVAFDTLREGISQWWQVVVEWFRERWEAITRGVGEIMLTLQGFINPLVDIKNWIFGLIDRIPAFIASIFAGIKSVIPKFFDFLEDIPAKLTAIFAPVLDFLKGKFEALKGFGEAAFKFLFETVPQAIGGALDAIFKALKGLFDWGVKAATAVLKLLVDLFSKSFDIVFRPSSPALVAILTPLSLSIAKSAGAMMLPFFPTLVSAFIDFVKDKAVDGKATPYDAFIWMIPVFLQVPMLAHVVGSFLYKIGHLFEVHIEPELLGSKFLKFIGLNPATAFKQLARAYHHIPVHYSYAMMYGTAIWLSQPLARAMSYTARNMFVIELPTLPLLHEVAQRHMPTDKFLDVLEYVRMFMRMYGYRDDIVNWHTTLAEDLHVVVLDRFKRRRELPVSLMYEIPTATDFARMMVRDLFWTAPGEPEKALDEFAKALLMRGMTYDTASFYYMLHFKYITMEKLYEFICRCAAGFGWIPGEPEIVGRRDKELGYPGLSPKELSELYSRDPLKSIEILTYFLIPYAKWHDFATFAWIQMTPEWKRAYGAEAIEFPADGKFTSDALIYLDTMADIPLRIDARWMYKWMLIDDDQLMRIVIARAMHPKWVTTITKAEAMNALAEERTLARSSLLRVYREGFLTLESIQNAFKDLIRVRILGEDIPVRFLPGEADLLLLSGRYDRAFDILHDYFMRMRDAVADNLIILTPEEQRRLIEEHARLENELKRAVRPEERHAIEEKIRALDTKAQYDRAVAELNTVATRIGKVLNIPTVFDKVYASSYEPTIRMLWDIRTAHRVRGWLRYSLWRLLWRYAEGFTSPEEVAAVIDELCRLGNLTLKEKSIIGLIINLMREYFERSTRAKGILKKLSKGVITKDEAFRELKALGLDKDAIEALIEEKAKVYVLSIANLLSYADLVEIPVETMMRKIEVMGVPKDEVEIILEVFRLRPIKDERSKVVSKLLEDFRDGYITEEELRKELTGLQLRGDSMELLILAAKYDKANTIRKYSVEGVLNKLRRGAITLKEGKDAIMKIIKDEALVDALIEKNVRIYTFSFERVLAMHEYIPIDPDWFAKKCELVGIPPDELKLVPAYITARVLSAEARAYVSEIGMLYAKGLITREDFIKELDNVATLWGTVRNLGVDWVIFSPNERKFIFNIYEARRLRYAAR